MRVDPVLRISQEELAHVSEKWGVIEIALFGSAARGEARQDSDIDLMVAFKRDARIGIWELLRLQEDLESLLNRRVDLVEKGTIVNPYRRASIQRDLRIVYAA